MQTLKRTTTNHYLSNINAVLLLVGYALFTSIVFGTYMPQGETTKYSIIFRVFAEMVAIIVIIYNINTPKVIEGGIKYYFLLWIFYSFRILYDLFIRSDSDRVSENDKYFLLLFIYGVNFIPMVAIYLSNQLINLKKIFYYIFAILLFIVIKGSFINYSNFSSGSRLTLNAAQSSLAFGSYSAFLVLAALTIIKNNVEYNCTKRVLLWCSLLIGLFGVGIAASRGPFVALSISILCGFFYKNKIKTIISFVLIAFTILFYYESIFDGIKMAAPTLYSRIYATIVFNDSSGRDVLYSMALNQIYENPFLGDWFLIDQSNVSGSSAHNAILDTTRSLGFLGGLIIIGLYIFMFQKSVKLITEKSLFSFWGYITIYCIIHSLTTGGNIISKPDFNFAFVVLLLIYTKGSGFYLQKNKINTE